MNTKQTVFNSGRLGERGGGRGKKRIQNVVLQEKALKHLLSIPPVIDGEVGEGRMVGSIRIKGSESFTLFNVYDY